MMNLLLVLKRFVLELLAHLGKRYAVVAHEAFARFDHFDHLAQE